jgi:hypothetical protein
MQRRGQERAKFAAVADPLVLAAVERAERHGREWNPHWIVAEHLGFESSRATARRLRPRLESLAEAGLLEQKREQGRDLWRLTARGRRLLTLARRRGKLGELPESPRHREWRQAREAAADRIDEIRQLVASVLAEAAAACAQPEVVRSDEWLALSERLQWAFWLIGSATYCLREWPEPDEEAAAVEADAPDRLTGRPSRRSVHEWEEAQQRAR